MRSPYRVLPTLRLRHVLIIPAILWASPVVAQQTGVAADHSLLERADAARTVGPPTAEVAILEFIDFACSDCRDFHHAGADSLRALVAEENVIFSIRVFPIPRLMRGFQAAEAAFCAAAFMGRPGFLGMLQQLFDNQQAWRQELDPAPLFETYAEQIDAPMDEFRACAARDAVAPLIISDVRLAKEMGVPGTPTFVFTRTSELSGAEKFYGRQPMSRFRESIEKVRRR